MAFCSNGLHDTGQRIRFYFSIKVSPRLLYQIYFIIRSILYSHPSHLTFPLYRSIPVLFLQVSAPSNPSCSFETSRHVSISFLRFLLLFLTSSAHIYQPLPISQKTTRAHFLLSFSFLYFFKETVYGSFSVSFSCLYVEDKAGLLSVLSVWWVSDCPSVWDVAVYCAMVLGARGSVVQLGTSCLHRCMKILWTRLETQPK